MMKTATIRNSWRIAAMIAVIGASACGGCGEEEPEPTPMADTGVDMGSTSMPDEGTDEPDLPPMVDRDLPGGLLLRMTPGRDIYPPGIRLLPEVEVYDAFGDPADFEWELTVEPAGAATAVDGGRFELAEEGVVRFTACTTKNGPDGEPVCGWDEVVVDAGPPVIEITSPLPGAMLDATANQMIDVQGSVTDSFGDVRAYLNGVPLELDADGNFDTQMLPRFGVNHVEISATDGLDPTTSLLAVDALWAQDYAEPTDPAVNFDDGVALRLGQLFMDDRVGFTTNPDGTTVTQDLADIMSLVVRNIDIASQIPNPVVNDASFTLSVPSINIGKPNVQIDIIDGGLEIFVQIPDLLAITEGSFTFDNTQLDLDGSLTAGMSALIVVSIDKPAGSPVQVTVDSLSVAIESATPAFASDEANAIFALASSVLRTTLEELLLDTLEGSFVDQIPALLADVFGALDSALSNQSIDLDTGLGQPINLSIDGTVETVDAVFRDHLTATLSLTADTSNSGTYPDSRGVPMLYELLDPAFFLQSRVQFGLRFAMVNSLLNALWQAGLLEADVTDVVPVNVDRAQLSAKLPPIVRPPLDGEPNDFVIELGQLEIETEILGRTDRYGVNISTGVDFGIDQGAIQVTIGQTPRIRTWLISASEDTPFLTADALKGLIEGQVWPEFTAAFADGLSIQLPAPDLSGLGGIAAPLAGLTLEYLEERPLALRDGWIVLDATMRGTLPAP